MLECMHHSSLSTDKPWKQKLFRYKVLPASIRGCLAACLQLPSQESGTCGMEVLRFAAVRPHLLYALLSFVASRPYKTLKRSHISRQQHTAVKYWQILQLGSDTLLPHVWYLITKRYSHALKSCSFKRKRESFEPLPATPSQNIAHVKDAKWQKRWISQLP